MINPEKFVNEFAQQFDEVPPEQFSADTHFKDFEEWSSMTALAIIAMVDDNYAVRLTGDEIRKAVTVNDILTVVNAKIK